MLGDEVVERLFTEESYALGFQKGQADWVAYVNDFPRAIEADGTYDRLYTKWLTEDVTRT